jgi:ribosome-associated toxin RatA of RatAB toxin-antitoxin module
VLKLKEMPHVDTVPVCSATGNLGYDEAQKQLFRRPYITLTLLLLSSPAPAADIDEVNVEAHREGNAVLINAVARVSADVDTAWTVLTDYDRYAEFIPDLKSSQVLLRQGNTAIVEQKGEAGFFLFHFKVEVTFIAAEAPRTSITSRALSGTFKEMTGLYLVAQEGEILHLTYTGRLVPDFPLPPLIGTAAVRAAVQKHFGALVKEIQRRALLQPK